MVRALDEPDAIYGLVAQERSPSRRTARVYRFRLRPEARFHDGSKLTAEDVAFSLNILKEKGHPIIGQSLRDMEARRGRRRRVRRGALQAGAGARRAARRGLAADLLARLLRQEALRREHAGAAARLRPLQGRAASRSAASSTMSATPTIGARGLPVNRRHRQFRRAALRIFPRPRGRLRGVQGARLSVPARSSPPAPGPPATISRR